MLLVLDTGPSTLTIESKESDIKRRRLLATFFASLNHILISGYKAYPSGYACSLPVGVLV